MTKMTKCFRRPQNLSAVDLMQWVFKNRVNKMPNGCLLWNGPVTDKNRPMIYHEGKNRQISRLFWEIDNNKPIPEGLQAGHTCEDSGYEHERCINPKHIIPVTDKEQEAMKKINQEGPNAYKDKQRKVQLELRKQKNKIMPAGITHNERVDWILEHDVEKDENGCLIYTREIGRGGYARRNINFNIESDNQSIAGKKKAMIHRYIYLVKNDLDYITTSIEDQVHHNCPVPEGEKPNRACVNPAHMKIGNRSENTTATRSYHIGTKLNEDLVRDILQSFIDLYKDEGFTKAQFYRDWVSLLEEDGIFISSAGIGNIFRTDRNQWGDIKEEIGFTQEERKYD